MARLRALAAAAAVSAAALSALPGHAGAAPATPIKHLVVIFDENVSFDHYFGLYPTALNPSGEPAFTPAPGTPAVNGLSGALLTSNPNGVNPFRLTRSQAVTCDNDHAYADEQKAFDAGAMDKFTQFVSCAGNTTMGYYDGNSVTALWNYAQHYTLSDAYYETVFGPSTPGALSLISGQTHGATPDIAGQVVNGTVISDPDPAGDECGNRNAAQTVSFGSAANIGTRLSAQNVTWGWFQGGFRPTGSDGGGAVCASAHANASGASIRDYSAHHEPFQYYDATRNPTHAAPASAAAIGHDDAPAAPVKVNHQYDLADFQTALDSGNVPEVSFLKAPASQDGHAGYSGPLDEQRFLVATINAIQASSAWPDTAIVVTYDDSDGWYDHQFSPIVKASHDSTYDALDGTGKCEGPGGAGTPTAGGYELRCGFGPRLPLLVISPYARVNAVDHTTLDQTSVLRFIEDNWGTGRIGDSSFDDIPSGKASLAPLFDFGAGATRAGKLVLDPQTGNPPAPAATPTPTATATPSPTPSAIVARAARRLTATAKPKRDRRRPFVFALSGRLTLPAGMSAATGCQGKLTIAVSAGKRVVTRRSAKLAATCKWSLKLRFKTRRKLGSGKLKVRVRFTGNAAVLARSAPVLSIRAG